MYQKSTVVFTDIVNSSKRWKEHPTLMRKYLQQHIEQVQRLSTEHMGLVLELIGDSFLLVFKGRQSYVRAVAFATQLQHELRVQPFLFPDESIFQLRMGICYGPVGWRVNHIQQCQLQSIFGNTVNTASRLESKVSPVGGLAFGFDLEHPLSDRKVDKVVKVMEDAEFGWHVKTYASHCLHNHMFRGHHVECDSITELKGVKPVWSIVAEPSHE